MNSLEQIDYLTYRRPPNAPRGLCQCGCGEATRIASKTHRKYGWIKGQPVRFLMGHQHRLVRYVSDPTPSGCLEWLGHVDRNGYGRVDVAGEARKAHRVVYEQHSGPIPDGLQLDHLCRNRACVNPEHLEIVTNAENSRRGANAKLAPEGVLEIRNLLAVGALTNVEIGRRLGVSASTVRAVKNGQCWRDVA